jgi:hypothetical protein
MLAAQSGYTVYLSGEKGYVQFGVNVENLAREISNLTIYFVHKNKALPKSEKYPQMPPTF